MEESKNIDRDTSYVILYNSEKMMRNFSMLVMEMEVGGEMRVKKVETRELGSGLDEKSKKGT